MKTRIVKYFIAAAFICSFCFGIFPANTASAATDGYLFEDKLKLTAECSILMEADSKRVLFASNALSKRAMASTTKIMTALVIIQNCNLDDVVTVPREAQGIEGSSIYLMAGEKLTVKELLYGLMLRSGNDAATALALHCSSSISEFAALMNDTARKIGALNTNFANPSGLPDPNHYTTAYDLALISAKAMESSVFREIVSTEKITISWGGHDTDRLLVNKNKMLSQYEGADGIKTGYTMAAGRCLVSSATRNGMTLIAVVLNCSPMYAECAALLDFGFQNYYMKEVVSPDTVMGYVDISKGFIDSIGYKPAYNFSFPQMQGDIVSTQIKLYSNKVAAPVNSGDVIGHIEVFVNSHKLSSIPLVLTESTKRNSFFSRFSALWQY